MCFGINVGGTHRDAVLLSGDKIVETCKVLTTSVSVVLVENQS